MSEIRRLRDAYRQPGFVPRAALRGVEADPAAYGVSLVRRRKKRPAERAADPRGASTISGRMKPAISIVPSVGSIFSSSFEGFSVGAVEP
jgi:hypothetical protein